jgi:hypothetical protein
MVDALHADTCLLRAVVGDGFFDETPEVPVVQLFLHMKQIRQKLGRVKELLAFQGCIDPSEEDAEMVGALENPDGNPSPESSINAELTCVPIESPAWSTCQPLLAELVEHLEQFVAYMNEQFAPTEGKLARMREYGQIEFEMLLYYYEPGMKLVGTSSINGPLDAMTLKSRSIDTDCLGNRFLLVEGYAYHFDGDDFTLREVETVKIYEYKGTRRIDGLPARELSSDIEAMLKGK